MSAPFYVSPEQPMADKAQFSRKGDGRGKSIITSEERRVGEERRSRG